MSVISFGARGEGEKKMMLEEQLLESCEGSSCSPAPCDPPSAPLTYIEQVDYSTIRIAWKRVPTATVYQI